MILIASDGQRARPGVKRRSYTTLEYYSVHDDGNIEKSGYELKNQT
jgi:hypothetical protein